MSEAIPVGTGAPATTKPAPELVIISGMSGAGRSTAADALEDLGWFVIDNLPPALILPMVELAARSQGAVPRVAVVVDVRGRSFFDALQSTLDTLDERGASARILFLDASDGALVQRFESVRRPHPLQGAGRIVDGILRERELLRELLHEADIVLDTTNSNVHELRAKIDAAFGPELPEALRATVVSFGYKHGLPVDADLVLDCRFLPNPHWVPELRPHTGQDPDVRAYVLGQPGAEETVANYAELVRAIAAGYLREGKRFATIAIGCTGGKHRSVAIAERLAELLTAAGGIEVRVVHRDMERE
ncbi:MAG TPA: RNase adapter RapZ [Actinomycetes bacterium]|nr:RNase adapter RapZ [Actinomycetes bacterium]